LKLTTVARLNLSMNYILKDYRLGGTIETHVQGAHR